MGCSSESYRKDHVVDKIILYHLSWRRPLSQGADIHSVRGEEGYESEPRPDSHFDCKKLSGLFQGIALAPLRECLVKSNRLQHTIVYVLKRTVSPYLEIKKLENFPSCLESVLPQIKVPREIFFQGKEGDEVLSCYNARIPIVEEEFLGIKNFLYPVNLKIKFPLTRVPETDDETQMLLGAWALAPFFDPDKKGIHAKVVPSEICAQCLGVDHLFRPTDVLPPYWP